MRGPGRPSAGLESLCCFEYLIGAHATIRQLVLSHSTKAQGDALRQVSRGLRAAVNTNVETVILELNAPRCDTELAEVFPEANRLRVVIPNPGDRTSGPGRRHVGLPQLTSELSVSALLEHVWATSPALVTKVQALTLSLGTISSVDDITAAVADFLSRCGKARSKRADRSTTLLMGLGGCYSIVSCMSPFCRCSLCASLSLRATGPCNVSLPTFRSQAQQFLSWLEPVPQGSRDVRACTSSQVQQPAGAARGLGG
jgi:hypothetical protein